MKGAVAHHHVLRTYDESLHCVLSFTVSGCCLQDTGSPWCIQDHLVNCKILIQKAMSIVLRQESLVFFQSKCSFVERIHFNMRVLLSPASQSCPVATQGIAAKHFPTAQIAFFPIDRYYQGDVCKNLSTRHR